MPKKPKRLLIDNAASPWYYAPRRHEAVLLVFRPFFRFPPEPEKLAI
jgi:hypothetical protein